jgi:hypothetical protein
MPTIMTWKDALDLDEPLAGRLDRIQRAEDFECQLHASVPSSISALGRRRRPAEL